MAGGIIDALLASDEPSVRWKIRTRVLGEPPDSARMRRLQSEIRRSPRVRALLDAFQPDGCARAGQGVYAKWQGAHWVLASLADLGYPPGDDALAGLRDRVLDQWLLPDFFKEFDAVSKADAYRHSGVPVMRGRYRRCASQQGNALWSLTTLGLTDDRAGALVERLGHWQWPDGGWNCDRNPAAETSSVTETWLPLRGLAAYADALGSAAARAPAARAAEFLLSRRVLFRQSTGAPMHREFTLLHYPLYWHFDVLTGLKIMAEVGALADERCAEALDLLESKRLPGGGWPAEKRYYRPSADIALGNDFVDWGGTSTKRFNEWVSADALAVLRAAGRLELNGH